MIRLSPLSIIGIFLFVISACDKAANLDIENSGVPTEAVSTVQLFTAQYGSIQTMSKSIQDIVLSTSLTGGSAPNIPTCVKVTPDVNAKTIKIDFGSGCNVQNNVTLKGICLVSYTGSFGQEGAVISGLFSNFYINENALNGKIEFKDFSKGTVGSQLEYRLVFTDLQFIQSGKKYVFNLNLKQAWKGGYTTATESDNEVLTELNGDYSEPSGISYTISTVKALLTLGSCMALTYPVPLSGTLDMTPKTGPVVRVDFGSGNCDSKATISVSGKSKEIDL